MSQKIMILDNAQRRITLEKEPGELRISVTKIQANGPPIQATVELSKEEFVEIVKFSGFGEGTWFNTQAIQPVAQACELCKRTGVKLSQHHLIPRQNGGGGKGAKIAYFCLPCSQEVHVLFTNHQLETDYNSIDKLNKDPRIQKWVAWVQAMNPTDVKVVVFNEQFGLKK